MKKKKKEADGIIILLGYCREANYRHIWKDSLLYKREISEPAILATERYLAYALNTSGGTCKKVGFSILAISVGLNAFIKVPTAGLVNLYVAFQSAYGLYFAVRVNYSFILGLKSPTKLCSREFVVSLRGIYFRPISIPNLST